MYRIEYNKKNDNNTLSSIKSLTIETDDIKMMRNVDVIYNSDKHLVALYLKYLKFCHDRKNNFHEFTILNNNIENEMVIKSIISSDWLINQDTLSDMEEELLQRKKEFEKKIDVLKDSTRLYDQHQVRLMQYFIDSISYLKDIDELDILDEKIFMKGR